MPRTPRIKNVALYLRISHDPDNRAVGVKRQREDCLALATAKFPTATIHIYTDNDVSAYRNVRRPEYTRLLADLDASHIDAIIAWNLDRLLRQPRDLESLIDRGIPIVTATGDLDLTTHDGQLQARILAAVAKKSSDDTARRVARSARDRAAKGLFNGARYTPYGYAKTDQPGHLVIDPAAAEVIRAVTRRVISGEPLGTVIRDYPSPPAPSKREGWRILLTGNTVRGLNAAGHPAVWEPILTPYEAVSLREILTPHSRTRPNKRWPLSAVTRCGKCGGKLYGRTIRDRYRHLRPIYICGTCWGTAISAPRLEQFVTAALDATVIERDPLPPRPTIDPERDRKLEALMDDYLNGNLTEPEWRRARDHLTAAPVTTRQPPPPVTGWERLSIIDHITISPTDDRGPVFNPDRIHITWSR
jgi:DNA invertase Pin-like site-specific DNA recombinase